MKNLHNDPVLKKKYYNECFGTEAGQAVLLDLFKEAGFDCPSTHVPNDPYTSAFNEGAKAAIWRIKLVMNANVDFFLKEAAKHRSL